MNRISRFEVPLIEPHVNIGIELTNLPNTRRDDNRHLAVPQEVLHRLHGAGKLGKVVDVPDYITNAVIRISGEDIMPSHVALRLLEDPTEEEIQREAGRIVPDDDWFVRFRETTGEDPTEEDREYCRRETALAALLEERQEFSNMLDGAPPEVMQTIRDKALQICRIPLDDEGRTAGGIRRSVDLNHLYKIDTIVRNRRGDSYIYEFSVRDENKYLFLTGKRPDGSYRWFCHLEPPNWRQRGRDTRGLALFFPYEMLERLWATKVFWISDVYPRVLRGYPSPVKKPVG